ncbi:hypothetical protein [Agarivorans aestuarii]|uniref:hypothetical protein n=1 Tax=Agarivorans aestuarii TaxID=1563703 RepID=UPI001C800B25|nr:hypothetical protein [Agarivorans aestuarii]
MNSYNRQKYLKLMYEATLRLETLRDFLSGIHSATYNVTTIESEALQVRKLLELIAYASLVSNREAYETVKKDLAKDWHAERILRKVESVNPSFYPVPLNSSGTVKGGFLTRKQFSKLYDKCGGILHAKNPFSKSQRNYLSFEAKIPEYVDRIENLLKHHKVTLASKEILIVTVPTGSNQKLTAKYYKKRESA